MLPISPQQSLASGSMTPTGSQLSCADCRYRLQMFYPNKAGLIAYQLAKQRQANFERCEVSEGENKVGSFKSVGIYQIEGLGGYSARYYHE